MPLYPCLEDMEFNQMSKLNNITNSPNNSSKSTNEKFFNSNLNLYPMLNSYASLNLTLEEKNFLSESEKNLKSNSTYLYDNKLISSLSGNFYNFQNSQINHNIREVIIYKVNEKKIGLRLHVINSGVFVVLIIKNSPAAFANLRFGDQILKINENSTSGLTQKQLHNMIKKSLSNKIKFVVRDRPFERKISLYKDQSNQLGFVLDDGKIIDIHKNSSAARNGLLTDHNILEINGQNVVGLPSNDLHKIIQKCENFLTLTIMPSSIYDHLIKNMEKSLIIKFMDHNIYDI